MVVAGGTGKGTDTPAVRLSDPKSSSFIIAADMLGLGPPTFFAAATGIAPGIADSGSGSSSLLVGKTKFMRWLFNARCR